MSVKLRERKIKNGKVSYYLDINYKNNRWSETLDIYVPNVPKSAMDKEYRKLAEEIRAKREYEIVVENNGLKHKLGHNINFIDYFEHYCKNISNNLKNRTVLSHLKSFIGNKFLALASINAVWIMEFQNHLLKWLGNNTAFSYMLSINACLNTAVSNKLISSNPYKEMNKNYKLSVKDIFRNNLTLEQIEKLAQTKTEIHPQIKAAFLLSCFTGLRWSDCHCLRWNEIITKMKEGKIQYFIYFEQEKTENIEFMPLMEAAIEILELRKLETQTEMKSEYVFPYLVNTSTKNPRSKYKIVCRALDKWGKEAQLPVTKLKFHTARHSFACNVYEHCPEVDIYMLQKLLGHKNIQSTMVYTKVRERHIHSALQAMPKFNLKGYAA